MVVLSTVVLLHFPIGLNSGAPFGEKELRRIRERVTESAREESGLFIWSVILGLGQKSCLENRPCIETGLQGWYAQPQETFGLPSST